MRTTRLLATCYAAIDDMIFASPDALPALNDRYEAAFASYAAAMRAAAVETDLCAHCRALTPVIEMAALDTDYTAQQAGPVWGIARDDLLCQDCRDEFEAEFGLAADTCDGSDDKFERYFNR